MKTYTFILEFEGGTYIAQVDAENEDCAFDMWKAKILGEKALAQRTTRFVKAIERQETDLTPISDVAEVWYFSLIFANELTYGHVILSA